MGLDAMTLALAKAYTDRHGGGGGASAPDWNENNEANPGYIKNRTHYDSRAEEVLLSSSGENVDCSDLIKISDEVMTLDELKISRIEMSLSVNSINFDNAIFYYDGYVNPSESVIASFYFNDDLGIEIAITVNSSTTADAGMYLGIDENGTGTYSMKLYGEVGELKTLDPKYIKDMYYAKDEEVEAYPETELTTETYNTTDTSYITNFVDKTLYHSFDGVIYKCTVTSSYGQYDVVSEDGTELPFEIRFNPSSISTQCYIKSSAPFPHTIKAFSIEEKVYPLDTKYLPNEVYTASRAPIYYGTSTDSTVQGYNTTASGMYSHAEGDGSTASGTKSHAEGYDTTASGYTSHAEGRNTKATSSDDSAQILTSVNKGDYTHAEGYGTVAYGSCSHAEGNGAKASGAYSHAEGWSTHATGQGSHAEGYATYATDNNSHAEGSTTKASGLDSHAEGSGTIASGSYSHAEGWSPTASGSCSHAEGRYTTASSDYSHAEGRYTTASGISSHAEGDSTNRFSSVVTTTNPTNDAIITAWSSKKFSMANGKTSHVEGTDNLALGDYSHAEGYETTAKGAASHAEGYDSTARGAASHAEGYSTTALGKNSHAEGLGTVANSISSHIIGEYNVYDASEFVQKVTEVAKICSGAHYFGTEFSFNGTTGEFTISGGEVTDDPEVAFIDAGWIYMSSGYDESKYSNNEYVDSIIYKFVSVENLGTETFNVEEITSIRRTISRVASDNAFAIGNGTNTTNRSNAATVDWSGNAWYAGDVYVGSTSGTNKDEGSKKLATEEYVNSVVPEIPSIPTALPNPYALTFTGAVTGSYDGSEAVSVEIPSTVTDDHINSLIDTKLGVIENGSY